VDALGNPTSFALTPGQAHDLEGADLLLPAIQADTVIADKAYDADERVIRPLERAGKTFVIPPRSNRNNPRLYDRELYKARHLIENFFALELKSLSTAYLPFSYIVLTLATWGWLARYKRRPAIDLF
jgi:transposase